MPDTQHTTQLITRERPLFDEARLAVASFLARYSDATRVSYTADLRYWFAWCHECHLDVFSVRRGHLELWARMQEDAGVPLRDVQIAARHADPRTTTRYDRARNNLDRHASYIVAAFIAGGA
jgi:hypothetical protein